MAKSIVRTLMLVPMMVTPVVAGLSWRIIYDPDAGILNYFLNLLGIHSNKAWLANAKTALYAVSAVDIWQWTPFIILITLAGLESLPVDIYEAAEVDGATWTQAFRYITIPLLSTTIFLALLIRTIDVLKFFDLILIMTNGGPGTVTETLNMYAYKTGFVYFRFGYASTIAFIYTLVVSLVLPFFVNRIWAEGG
jgi:multiple sugar transport system permease protein